MIEDIKTISFKELMSIFYHFTEAILNNENEVSIRKSYQTNSAPFQEIQDPTIYYWINFVDTPINNQVNEINKYVEETGEYYRKYWNMRQIQVMWSIYGLENAIDISSKLRLKLYSYQAKSILDSKGIGLITDTPDINIIPEIINNRWWKRIDVSCNYYVNNVEVEDLNSIENLDVGLVPNPSTQDKIDGIINGDITDPMHSSTLCRDIELDLEELRKEAEKRKGGK